MSVIYGICSSSKSVVEREVLLRLADVTSRYGPDGTSTYCAGRIGMGFQGFHTHQRAHLEGQPIVDQSGNVLAFDGRLDNYEDIASMTGSSNRNVPDSTLVLRAFEKWGPDCFSHLVGDWAVALWFARDQVLYLARDHAGARTLYFSNDGGTITYSSYLETFFVGAASRAVDKEYVALAMSCEGAMDRTPYAGIRAVLPAHYVSIRDGQVLSRPHWRWIADTQISYRSSSEYDEHFLHLFQAAVKRRIVPGAPVLAELSGGMDSSAIVCMADRSASSRESQEDRLDTVSYFDDTEPDWDERPYFTAVETYRQKVGIHIDCSSFRPTFAPLVISDRIYPYPLGDHAAVANSVEFGRAVGNGRYRVILSGIGGDELLGGVPTPMPELADYLWKARIPKLLSTATRWCVATRQPLAHMLYNTAMYTARLYAPGRSERAIPPPWLSPDLRDVHSEILRFNRKRVPHFPASLPSSVASGRSWWKLLETLRHLVPPPEGCYEFRYPYLDRDLVDYLLRVPREQLVQPGRRRFLMRRALKDIVPVQILERRRKAFISHGPIVQLRHAEQKIEELFENSSLAQHGIIDRKEFLKCFRLELAGEVKWIGHLTKTINMELWMHRLSAQHPQAKSSPMHRSGVQQVLPV